MNRLAAALIGGARPGEELCGQAREDAIIEAARALNDLDIDVAAFRARPWTEVSRPV